MKKGFVAINSSGDYLVANVVPRSGFSSKHIVSYSWTKDIAYATLLPNKDISISLRGPNCESLDVDHIKKDIIAVLPALEQRTIILGELK